jgi:hypothetical protein
MVMVLSRRRFLSCARPSRSGRCAIAQIRRGLRLLSPVPPCGTEACAVSPVPSSESGHFPETIIFATTQLPNRVRCAQRPFVETLFADPKAPGASASAHCGTRASGRPRRPYRDADGNSGAHRRTSKPSDSEACYIAVIHGHGPRPSKPPAGVALALLPRLPLLPRAAELSAGPVHL